tara:strand:- start:1100 stop:1318 length:219 start_codon:yes stop_codon:yes gene_type:complete
MSERRRYSSMRRTRSGIPNGEPGSSQKFDIPGLTKMDSYLPPILDETGEEIDDAPDMNKGMQISELFNSKML